MRSTEDGRVGIGTDDPNGQVQITNNSTTDETLIVGNDSASFGGNNQQVWIANDTAASTSFNFLLCGSGTTGGDSGGTTEAYLRGDGIWYTSGATSATLDYAEYFESIDTDQIKKTELTAKFLDIIDDLKDNEYPITHKIYFNKKPYSIGSYGRDLNDEGCEDNDFIIWGETDMLFPKEMFQSIEAVSEYAKQQNIHRYCLTFATRKMWGDDWKVLEHNNFTNNRFTEMHDNLWQNDPSSIWYTMSIEEMNKINDIVEDFDINIIDYPRFEGSGLVISTDLIQNGINIPRAVWACGEDTAFQNLTMRMMGKNFRQFVVKNILKDLPIMLVHGKKTQIN